MYKNNYCHTIIILNAGGIQLGLLLLLIFLTCAVVCVPCCLCVCLYDDDDDVEDILGKLAINITYKLLMIVVSYAD